MSRVTTIDCEYVFPQFAAAYLIEDATEAAFIDNNTLHAVPRLLAALKARGLTPAQVRYIIVTHVHLDHASGTAELLRHCPQATILAHPRAAPHLIDPAKLVASARQVYGAAIFDKLYGAILPIDAKRVRPLDDGARVALGNRELRFLHTRGHANHHFCIQDGDTIFTGDAFGLRYPALQKHGLFVLPSTSPTDFDAALAVASIERIAASGATHAYPTHFGEVTDLARVAQELTHHLDFSGALLERALVSSSTDAELDAFCLTEIQAHMERYTRERKLPWATAERELLKFDLQLNAQGIAFVARKRRHAAA